MVQMPPLTLYQNNHITRHMASLYSSFLVKYKETYFASIFQSSILYQSYYTPSRLALLVYFSEVYYTALLCNYLKFKSRDFLFGYIFHEKALTLTCSYILVQYGYLLHESFCHMEHYLGYACSNDGMHYHLPSSESSTEPYFYLI